MDIIIINKNELKSSDIDETREKVRAILIDGDRILISNYGGVVLFPGGSVDNDILPEIGDLSMIASKDEDIVPSVGMDLPIANGMETSQGRSNVGTSSDSQTIAQAIRTVLARDS